MAEKFMRMLTAMAGDVVSFAHGEIVRLEATVADAWKDAGIAEPAPKAAELEKSAKDLATRVAELERDLELACADRDAAKEQAEQLGEQLAEVSGKLGDATAQLEAATKAKKA